MNIPYPLKIAIIALAVVSLFVFPWPLTLVLMALAGLILPASALCIGVLSDILYYPGFGLPWGVLAGLLIALGAALVRHIMKTRIM